MNLKLHRAGKHFNTEYDAYDTTSRAPAAPAQGGGVRAGWYKVTGPPPEKGSKTTRITTTETLMETNKYGVPKNQPLRAKKYAAKWDLTASQGPRIRVDLFIVSMLASVITAFIFLRSLALRKSLMHL